MDAEYESEWWKWVSKLTPGQRAELRSKGLIKPWVERAKPGGGWEDNREEQDAKTRFEETAAHEVTPVQVIVAAEIERRLKPAKRAALERQRLQNRHFHLFAMFMGTGVEQFDLLKLRVIIMLRHAAPLWLAKYGLMNGCVDREMGRLRRGLNVALRPQDYIPLCDVLGSEAEAKKFAQSMV